MKFLKLYLEDFGLKIGKMEAIYLISRPVSSNRDSLIRGPETTIKYNIVEAITGKKTFANRVEKTMEVKVNLHTEVEDLQSLAGELKEKYKSEIVEQSLDEFVIVFNVEHSENRYCINKCYTVFYEKAALISR